MIFKHELSISAFEEKTFEFFFPLRWQEKLLHFSANLSITQAEPSEKVNWSKHAKISTSLFKSKVMNSNANYIKKLS